MNTTDRQTGAHIASARRQLTAALYDGLLLIALLLIAVAITIPLTQAGIISPNSPLLSVYLLSICFFFYAGFWVRGRQTLGMRVWHISIEQLNGKAITWRQAAIRFLTGLPAWGMLILGLIRLSVPDQIQTEYFVAWLMAIHPIILLGIACIWLVIDHSKNSWRDKLSETHIIMDN